MILICTPCYSNSVNVNYFQSMTALTSENKIAFDIQTLCNDSLIPRVRNAMVATFLADERNYTHLMWIDSDIGFQPDDVYRLLDADLDVVGGIYPYKGLYPPDPVPAMTTEELRLRQMRYPFNVAREFAIPLTGMVEVHDVPCGFMLIKRTVLTTMITAYPDLKYRPDITPVLDPKTIDYHYRLFDTNVEDGRYVGEDFAFCHRWQKLGGKVHADLFSRLSHQGQYLYQGNILGTLAACGAVSAAGVNNTTGEN